MTLRIPLGISDFSRLREERLSYVDKSLFIRDVIDDTASVILFPRPRRFGKTLNLSMLRAFFEKSPEDRWPLFADLAIATAGDAYRAHCGRYPTLAMTFKDVKTRSWQDCQDLLSELISRLYGEHRYLLDLGALSSEEAVNFAAILDKSANNAVLWDSLRALSQALHRHHGERVLILIDEYDTPIHAGLAAGYYDDIIEFFRNFLSGGLKDNSHLYKGVLTGILRVAKDSIFTGLNNLEVYSLLRPEYAGFFGFTEAEVGALMEQGGCADKLPEVQHWYNGYLFGGQVIYNPWSVLSYLKSQDRQPRPYWAETSGNDLVRDLIMEQGGAIQEDWERLLRGETIEKKLRDNLALRELGDDPGLVWSFLLFTGYLKVVRLRQEEDGTLLGTLAVPNREVHTIFAERFSKWLIKSVGGDQEQHKFLAALLSGDAEQVERYLATILMRHASFHDTALFQQPERFYHGLVLGLLVSLSKGYEVRSNPEAGHGRCDLLISPRQAGQPGVVLELKVADRRKRETLGGALKAAQRQLIERDYAATLRAGGAAPVHELAVAWSQKDVRVALARRVKKTKTTHKE